MFAGVSPLVAMVGATALGSLLVACSPSEKGGVTVITVNVKMAAGAEAAKCESLFADTESLIKQGPEGSSWTWFKPNNTRQHYCQRRSDGSVSAWAEVLESDSATHSLTFDSRREDVIFQALPSKI